MRKAQSAINIRCISRKESDPKYAPRALEALAFVVARKLASNMRPVPFVSEEILRSKFQRLLRAKEAHRIASLRGQPRTRITPGGAEPAQEEESDEDDEDEEAHDTSHTSGKTPSKKDTDDDDDDIPPAAGAAGHGGQGGRKKSLFPPGSGRSRKRSTSSKRRGGSGKRQGRKQSAAAADGTGNEGGTDADTSATDTVTDRDRDSDTSTDFDPYLELPILFCKGMNFDEEDEINFSDVEGTEHTEDTETAPTNSDLDTGKDGSCYLDAPANCFDRFLPQQNIATPQKCYTLPLGSGDTPQRPCFDVEN